MPHDTSGDAAALGMALTLWEVVGSPSMGSGRGSCSALVLLTVLRSVPQVRCLAQGARVETVSCLFGFRDVHCEFFSL